MDPKELTAFPVRPDETIPTDTPQAAAAADVPSVPPSGGADEGSAPAEPAGTVPSAGGGDTEGAAGAESGETAEVYLPVYNGTPVPIRADDRERVTALLREGLRFEQFLPQFETLRRMSAAAGFRRPEELIEQLQHTAEEEEYRELLARTGGDEALAREICTLRRERQQGYAPEVPPEPETPVDRLAAEYEELQRAIPDAPSFAALPDTVIREACAGTHTLLDGYLRFAERERQLRREADAAAQAAATCAAGSLHGEPENGQGGENAFRHAFRRSL